MMISGVIETIAICRLYVTLCFQRYFRDPIRVHRIKNHVPESEKIINGSLELEKIGSVQVHTGYLTISLTP